MSDYYKKKINIHCLSIYFFDRHRLVIINLVCYINGRFESMTSLSLQVFNPYVPPPNHQTTLSLLIVYLLYHVMGPCLSTFPNQMIL